jgi:hypothetical protein
MEGFVERERANAAGAIGEPDNFVSGGLRHGYKVAATDLRLPEFP